MAELSHEQLVLMLKKKKAPVHVRIGRSVWADRHFLPMMLPAAVCLIIWSYLPMPGVLIAFQQMSFASPNFFVNLFNPRAWVGLDQFMAYLDSPNLWLTLRNTLSYNIAFLVTGTVGGVFLAIAATELWNKRIAKLYQSVLIFPAFLSWVIISYILFSLLGTFGVFNTFLTDWGMQPVAWYAQGDMWPFLLPALNLWKGVGLGSIFYFAAISSIDQEMYESAALDGASRIKQIWHITLPFLKPTIIVLTILALGGIIRTDFGLFYVATREMGGGMLYESTVTIDVFTFSQLRSRGNLPLATAVGLMQSLVGLLMIIGVNLIVRKVDKESAMF